jgi:hypothetical protein
MVKLLIIKSRHQPNIITAIGQPMGDSTSEQVVGELGHGHREEMIGINGYKWIFNDLQSLQE